MERGFSQDSSLPLPPIGVGGAAPRAPLPPFETRDEALNELGTWLGIAMILVTFAFGGIAGSVATWVVLR